LATRLGKDPTTIVNEYARPKAGSLRPMCRELPEVVDHRDEQPDIRMAFGRGEEHALDNVMVWLIWYRTEYADGHLDAVCISQTVVSPHSGGEFHAIETLRRLQRGYKRIHIYEISAPPTVEQIAATREADHRQHQIRMALAPPRKETVT
jgi:hypothetical protein